MKEANKYYREYQQIMGKNNSISALCRSQKGEEAIKCQEGLKPAKIDEKTLYDKWMEHTANAEKMILSLWNGNSKIMKELILELAKKEPPPTQKEIKDRFSYTLPWVSHGLKETKSSLLNQSEERSKNVSRSEGFQTERVFKDDLTDKAKTELLQLAISNGYFDKDFGEAEKPILQAKTAKSETLSWLKSSPRKQYMKSERPSKRRALLLLIIHPGLNRRSHRSTPEVRTKTA